MTKKLPSSTSFLYFVLLWCIFSFKVLLGGVGEAGLRVDDLLIAVAFAILAFRGDLVRIPRSRAFRAYLIFLSISFCSSIWNWITGRVTLIYSVLFVIRLLEYLVFYYLGYVLCENGVRVWRGLRIYFYLVCVLAPLQMMSLLPTASAFGASRASGNTNGPYELAAVSSFFLCYFGYRERKWVGSGLSIVLLILTASRSTVAGAIVAFVVRTVSLSKSAAKAVTVVILVMLALWGGSTWISSTDSEHDASASFGDRLKSSTTLLSVDYQGIYSAIPDFQTSAEYMAGMYRDTSDLADEVDADKSGIDRVLRWSSLIKSTLLHFDSIVIGLGPSFGSAAVDGYFVRVFIETGLAGVIAFFLFLRTLTKQGRENSAGFCEFAIILIVTACFIDIFASYKTMLLLWLWNGMSEWEWRHKARCV
jgi:hypothetical protein